MTVLVAAAAATTRLLLVLLFNNNTSSSLAVLGLIEYTVLGFEFWVTCWGLELANVHTQLSGSHYW